MVRTLGWSDVDAPRPRCPGLDKHVARFGGKTLSVVYVSDYIENPASAFGHAMLFLGSADTAISLDDYTVSFEADIEDLSPREYMPRALKGDLSAGYRVEPLYERVKRYERDEQRDLWLFPLGISAETVELLVLHLWELNSLTIRYGFVGDNCAQKLLALVHAVAPEFGILPYRSVAVLPSDAVRHMIHRIGLAGSSRYRPALSKSYSERLGTLPVDKKRQLKRMLATRVVSPDAPADVVELAFIHSELQFPSRAFHRSSDSTDHPDHQWRRKLWAVLASNPDFSGSPTPVLTKSSPLLKAHEASRVTIRGGVGNSGMVFGIGARWLLHDAIDPGDGYRSGSSLEIGQFEMLIGESGKPRLKEGTVFSLERLGFMSDVTSRTTWSTELGLRRLAFRNENAMHIGAEFQVGLGGSLSTAGYRTGVFARLGARPGVKLEGGRISAVTVGLATIGAVFRLPEDIRGRASIEYAVPNLSGDRAGVQVEATIRKGLRRNLDLEVDLEKANHSWAGTFGLSLFR